MLLFDSLDAAEAEDVLNGPSTSMNNSLNEHTLLLFYLNVCFYLSSATPLISAPSYNTSFHFVVTRTNWCYWLTHFFICLCHTVGLTFDILIQFPKMSANYLHTMHKISISPFLVEQHFSYQFYLFIYLGLCIFY